MDLSGNTFLITGAGSGLGQACAELFAARGAAVIVADVNEQAGQAVATGLGDRAEFISTDVTSADQVQAAIDLAISRFGNFSGAVNCAGILGASRVVGRNGVHDLDLFRKVIEVNLIGTFNVVRLAAAKLTDNQPNEQGERGVIINTASVSAFEGQIGQAAYSASKGGVAGMTLPIARELGKFGIRVAAIAPGVFNTAMMQAAPDAVVESLKSQAVFPHRLGLPEEFASFAAHIVENPMLNGSVLRLDGAMRMQAK